MEESDGDCSKQTATGSDTAEGTQKNTVLVQMEEEERAIRAMPFVTTLSFVRAVKGKAEGWRVTLTCFACREYNSCGKKQEASVHISGERPTLHACLQELRKRLEEHHARQGAHIDRKNHLGNASGSALASHLLQQGLGHGARRHEDSAGCCDVSARSRNQPTTSTPCRFSMQGHHVMFFFYVSWCTEALCEEVVQLLVHGMLACAWPRTRIQVLWTESHGGRLYAHQADLLDRRRIYCHSIIRDSES